MTDLGHLFGFGGGVGGASKHYGYSLRQPRGNFLICTYQAMSWACPSCCFCFATLDFFFPEGILRWCKASLGWVIQGRSRSQKGKRGRKRGGGEERERESVCVCVWRRRVRARSRMRRNETIKKRCKVPRNRRARYGSRGSVERRRRAGEYGGASGRLPERLTAL